MESSPQRPPPDDARANRPPDSSPRSPFTWLAALGTLLSVLAFASTIYPGFALLIGVLFAAIGVQYLLWGKWLSQRMRRQDDDNDA